MVDWLTLLAIWGGVSSIIGAIIAIKTSGWGWFNRILIIIGFVAGVSVSVYALAVPGNILKENVRSKIELYQYTDEYGKVRTRLVQHGILVMKNQVMSVKFPKPYINPPEVFVHNPKGHRGSVVPKKPDKKDITPYFVTFRSDSRAIFAEEFEWIAVGDPLKPVEP